METRNTKISPEDGTRIDGAMEELASWDLIKLWVGESEYDDDGNLFSREVEYLRLEQHGLGHLLQEEVRTDLWNESMHVLAARKGLVTVTKTLPTDGIGSEEVRMRSLVENLACRVGDGFYHGVVGPRGARPRSEDPSEWVQEGTVVLIKFAPDEWIQYTTCQFTRFVARDKLTTEDLDYIEDFLQHGEFEPSCTYSIEPTDSLEMVADLYTGLNKA